MKLEKIACRDAEQDGLTAADFPNEVTWEAVEVLEIKRFEAIKNTPERWQYKLRFRRTKTKENYHALIVDKVRAKYSVDDEMAILRQRGAKPDEFNAYNSYVEQCKAEAKEELGIVGEALDYAGE